MIILANGLYKMRGIPIAYWSGYPYGVVANMLDCDTVKSLDSSHSTKSTFGLILRKYELFILSVMG